MPDDAPAPHSDETDALPFPSPRQALVLLLKGFCMGTADVIPGVSGGTVALILGVYRRLVEGIKSYHPKSVLALLVALPGLWNAARRDDLLLAARRLHFGFLIPLGAGIATAILIAARFIPGLMKTYPTQMSALFFGLILASTWVPFSQIKREDRSPLLATAALFAGIAAYWVVGLPILEGEASLGFIFLCGSIAICAMILPGVSGSYMLKALGQYENILTAVHERDLVTVAVFMCGMVVGITVFVRVLSVLFRRAEAATLAALTGVMLGSLRSVWPFRDAQGAGVLPSQFGGDEAIIGVLVVVGIAIVVGLIYADRVLGGSASQARDDK